MKQDTEVFGTSEAVKTFVSSRALQARWKGFQAEAVSAASAPSPQPAKPEFGWRRNVALIDELSPEDRLFAK